LLLLDGLGKCPKREKVRSSLFSEKIEITDGKTAEELV